MHTEISFPNLGIYLKNVGKSIDLFGIEIAYYGIIIGTAILLGFWIAAREAKRTGQNPENYLDMGIIGVIAGIVGGFQSASFPKGRATQERSFPFFRLKTALLKSPQKQAVRSFRSA